VNTKVGPRTILDLKDNNVQNDPIKRKKFYHLSKINSNYIGSMEVNLSRAIPIFISIFETLNSPDQVKYIAQKLYQKALKSNLLRGRSILHFVAATIYLAYKINKIPIPIEAIANAANLDAKKIIKTMHIISQNIAIKIRTYIPNDYIKFLFNKLNLDPSMFEAVQNFLKAVGKPKNELIGKNPKGIAAAVIFLVCTRAGIRMTKRKLTLCASVSEITLRKNIQILETFVESTQ
jgi:transcription initiation factor TFIIB